MKVKKMKMKAKKKPVKVNNEFGEFAKRIQDKIQNEGWRIVKHGKSYFCIPPKKSRKVEVS